MSAGATPTILITGPVRGLAEYAAAARAAGWTALERPLVVVREVEPRLELASGVALERILVTSRSAVAPLDRLATERLELREVPCSVVGERTRAALLAAGFTADGEAARDASALARALIEELDAPATLLWLRGSLSDELATALRAAGHDVLDPIVYRTEPADDRAPTPAVRAVFFASPSAVHAFDALAHEAPVTETCAVAIGDTTRAALEARTAGSFSAILSLAHPTPEDLTRVLRERIHDS